MNTRQLIALASLPLLLILVMPRCSAQQQQSISCYDCTAEKVSDSCGMPGTGTPTASQCLFCSTYVKHNVFRRECMQNTPVNAAPGCISRGPLDSTCICNGSSNCNTERFASLGDLTCYSCTSAGGIDNGCGEKLDVNSRYVKQVTGCTACMKHTTTENGHGVYTRGCAHYIDETITECVTEFAPNSMKCYSLCKTNLCNSATTGFDSTPAVVLVTLLACSRVLFTQRKI